MKIFILQKFRFESKVVKYLSKNCEKSGKIGV